ncbi:Speckle-type POZ protein [Araneus ventricosus]|uniref:Speckle-type POZ protein n=1 Tax=Araneus ventricosus TaxID=182803 RepID=A0A4Y2M5P7_ARAVE|nr:Speckle-type POZ protein [Araneus ventricosus]
MSFRPHFEMERDTKCFTITWRIENYDFCFQTPGNYYRCPSFVIDSVKDTSWKLKIYPKSSALKEHINFYVERVVGVKADFRLDYRISVFADDSSSPLYEGYSFKDTNSDYSRSCFIPHHKVYTKKRGVFCPPKTLTIRCTIFESKEESFSDAGQCLARTRIRVARTAFTGLAQKFSSLCTDEKIILLMKSFSSEKPLLTLNLSLTGDLCYKERVWVEIIPAKKDYIKFCKCKLFLLDSEGTKTECGRSEILFSETEPEEWKFPLNFTKGYIMKKSTQFLSNDTLSLKCEFVFSTGIEYEGIEDSEFGNLSFVDKNQSRKFPSALEDITCLYKDGILCDMKLRTETETFNVHKNILSARSSVFKTMFSTDMREKTTDCVIIEDLEADTVRRMLVFLYSDKLEDLDWESAKSLYFAADKYNIVALKYRCSDFLMNNLQPSGSSDILLLSDRHHDQELKKVAQEYIAEHHEEILQTDQWMNLEKSNPILTTETFRALYLRNCKN